jgi:histone acetyltransferase (RNA polymerase elongator complex component)
MGRVRTEQPCGWGPSATCECDRAVDNRILYRQFAAEPAELGQGQALPLLAGFLRLSLPHSLPERGFLDEIAGVAMIREVHIYGPALEIGEEGEGKTRHAGLGTALIERAAEIARAAGFSRLAVIAATGTREYYRARGFELGELYRERLISG